MTEHPCEREHGKDMLMTFVMTDGRRTENVTKCSYILGYRQQEGKGDNTIMCGDLPINEPLPDGFLSMGDVTGALFEESKN